MILVPRSAGRGMRAKGLNRRESSLLPCDVKRFAAGMSAAFLSTVLWPIAQNWRAEKEDGFPLSYYPMFSVKRKKRYRVTHLAGRTANGARVTIPYGYAGTGGLNQVRRQLRRTALEGGAESLCRAVAAKMGRRGHPSLAAVVEVELVTGEYRLDDYLRGSTDPVRVTVHASCPVGRQMR